MSFTSRSPLVIAALMLSGALAAAAPVAAQTLATDAGQPAAPVALSPDAGLPASLSFDAQQRAYRRAPAASTLGARVFGLVDVEQMTASQSFTAIVGTKRLLGFGAGADITGIGGGLFVRVALSQMSKSGTRTDGSQFANGIGVDVKMIPIDLAAGWRLEHLTPHHTVTPYAGGGALLLHYSETTPSGDTGDNVSAFFTGYEVFGGVDLRAGSLTIAPEVDYRKVPNAIGKGGVSQDFNETDLGGLAFRISIGARFGGGR